MKKLLFAVCCALSAALIAGPHFGPGPGHRPGPWRHGPPVHHHGHHYREIGVIGAGVLGAGLIASTIYDATRPRPVVVIPPPVVQPVAVSSPVCQNVWVPGRYIDTIGPNGVVVRQWQPGHWESRPVVLP